jgi:hypothetical protein
LPEICPHCGKEFVNTKALGSHLHYRHESNRRAPGFETASRSKREIKRICFLLEKWLLNTGLRLPEDIEKIELALSEISPGISSVLNKYRGAFARALNK